MRYLPSNEQGGVGADWSDVIPLSGARVALVVCHCRYTSATIGRLRAVVRALADLELPPDELLTELNRIICRTSSVSADEEAATATCLFVVYDPVARSCTVASAGHPPLAVVLPDGTAESVDVAVGPPLGRDGSTYEKFDVPLPEGSVLALYTDSLIERQSKEFDQGIAGLLQRLTARADSLGEVCDCLLSGLDQESPDDDVALLLARTQVIDKDHTVAWGFPRDPEAVATARERTLRTLTRWGLNQEAYTTEIVVSELVTNAIRHASGPIELRLILADSSLVCEVFDGSGTFPKLHHARVYEEGGRGLLMVAQLCQRWGTRSTVSGKVIWANQTVESLPAD